MWAMNYLQAFKLDKDTQEIIIEECKMHLCRTAELWDPSIAKWGTYATQGLFNCIKRAREKAIKTNLKAIPFTTIGTLDEGRLKKVTRKNQVFDMGDTELMDKMLNYLTPHELNIIKMRFFEDMTLKEVGAALTPSICRERVRQIQDRALLKLRDAFTEVHNTK
jgi:RNA polymerase sigma factor (sigma-70 family)